MASRMSLPMFPENGSRWSRTVFEAHLRKDRLSSNGKDGPDTFEIRMTTSRASPISVHLAITRRVVFRVHFLTLYSVLEPDPCVSSKWWMDGRAMIHATMARRTAGVLVPRMAHPSLDRAV
jgi:hypothetical protein